MSQTPLQAAQALANGDLILLPTETVYGLGADASNAEAVAAIFAAKGRPKFNPLISHVVDVDAADPAAVQVGLVGDGADDVGHDDLFL